MCFLLRMRLIEMYPAGQPFRFIMAECFKLKKRVPYGKINGSPWRLVNKNAGKDANVHGSKVA